MNDYLSSAPIVLHVVGKTECLLAEDRGKLLLFLDLLFVEDSAERAFSVSRLSAETSCVGFSLMSIVPGAMADVVVLLASSLTDMEMIGNLCTQFYLL